MFCGTSALHQIAAEDPPAAPKASKKHHSSSNKNPYSSRGLDKFSSVLSDLEIRKKKIMESASSHSVAMVRFMYSDSKDWIPVIVRLRENSNPSNPNSSDDNNKLMPVNELPPPPPPRLTKMEETPEPAPEKKKKKKKKEMLWWRWRPSYYMPVAMLVILLCFVISGRAFAICCTSVFWYLMPVMKGDEKKTNFLHSAYRRSYKRLIRRN